MQHNNPHGMNPGMGVPGQQYPPQQQQPGQMMPQQPQQQGMAGMGYYQQGVQQQPAMIPQGGPQMGMSYMGQTQQPMYQQQPMAQGHMGVAPNQNRTMVQGGGVSGFPGPTGFPGPGSQPLGMVQPQPQQNVMQQQTGYGGIPTGPTTVNQQQQQQQATYMSGTGGTMISQQQQQHPTQQQQIGSYQSAGGTNQGAPVSQQQMASSSASTGIVGSSVMGASSYSTSQGQLTITATLNPKAKELHEPTPRRQMIQGPYSTEILNNLEKYSVGSLTLIARELVNELNTRTMQLCSSMKLISERKAAPNGADPEQLLEYCHNILDKIVQIRILIEQKVSYKKLSADEYLRKMSIDNDELLPEVNAEVKKQHAVFEENRNRLVSINCDLKMLDWMAAVSDPSHLKKVDKMASTQPE